MQGARYEWQSQVMDAHRLIVFCIVLRGVYGVQGHCEPVAAV